MSDREGLRVRICQGAVLQFCSRQPFSYVSIKGPGCNHIPIQNLFHGRYLQKPSQVEHVVHLFLSREICHTKFANDPSPASVFKIFLCKGLAFSKICPGMSKGTLLFPKWSSVTFLLYCN